MKDSDNMMTHIVGEIVVDGKGAFLNGGGIDRRLEYRNYTLPKLCSAGNADFPYWSPQAWRNALRCTFSENTGWQRSVLRPEKQNQKGNTSKVVGELNPLDFAEDDIFGYMNTQAKDSKSKSDDDVVEGKNAKPVKTTARTSVFSASPLMSLRRSGWQCEDHGYVHLEGEGTPLPYNTMFYNAPLAGIFGLNMSRLGVFKNVGDRVELTDALVEKGLKSGILIKVSDNEYAFADTALKYTRAAELMKALAQLRGGAKQASFATDVSPKAMIFAGLNCGNLVFNSCFEDNPVSGKPRMLVDVLGEIIGDHKNKVVTPVYIGIRTGYLDNEDDIKSFVEKFNSSSDGDLPQLILTTPIKAVDKFVASYLKVD